jgi:hypothetical protein
MKQRIQLIYILAASHSGSTLLSMLLGSHSEICSIGELRLELKAYSSGTYRCSCGAFVEECMFWKRIKSRMASKGLHFDVQNACTNYEVSRSKYATWLLKPLVRSRFMEKMRDAGLGMSAIRIKEEHVIHKRNYELVRCLLEETGKTIIVDSSKGARRLKFYLRNPFFEINIIRLIRDGRAVALTYTDSGTYADASDSRFRGGGTGKYRVGENCGISSACFQWLRANEEIENILRMVGTKKVVRVKYEDLCERPRSVMEGLHEFIGVKDEFAWCNFKSCEHHVIGNGMRFDVSSDIIPDYRWRSALTEKDLEVFRNIAGNMNSYLGYEETSKD